MNDCTYCVSVLNLIIIIMLEGRVLHSCFESVDERHNNTDFVLQGQRMYNLSGGRTEKLGQVLIAYADHYKEVSSVEAGNIVVVTGLKVCFFVFL